MFRSLVEDAKSIASRDPAAKSIWEVFLLYPGFHAIVAHRIAHWLFKRKLFFMARAVSQISRFFTGIEIHPGAKIGRGLFIDHGMGVVIGETSEVGDNVTIYHGVTLGGTGKDKGKRHPTIGNNVLIGTGAKILGPFTVGDNARIGANAFVHREVPPNSTVVGVPGRVVVKDNRRVSAAYPAASIELDQVRMADPLSQEICRMLARVDHLEARLAKTENDRKQGE